MTPAISTRNLTKCFRRQRGLLDLFSSRAKVATVAVDRVTLEIKPGEIFGLLGPNGAGKTTLIKLLCTLLRPSSGEAFAYGHDVVREAHAVRQLVGMIASEERSFFWRLTGRQNLQFFAALYHLSSRQAASRIDELLDLLDLTDVGDVRFNEYSTGMRQKLGIARGLLSQPRILFMDEPTKGLDPISALALLRLIRQRVADSLGSTIILTTHILRDVEQLCDRIALLNKGRVVACGSFDELRRALSPEDQYTLKVRGLSDHRLTALSQIQGVVGCTKVSQVDGIIHFQMTLRRGHIDALSQALQRMLHDRCEILTCTLKEENVEDVFCNLLQPTGTNAPTEGVTNSC